MMCRTNTFNIINTLYPIQTSTNLLHFKKYVKSYFNCLQLFTAKQHTEQSVSEIYRYSQSSNYSTKKKETNIRKTMDPKRVMSYDDMLKVIHQPEKVIIDVRNPEEISSTGKIPSSINIPLGNVDQVLSSMSEEEFRKNYNRSKPTPSDELIFYCRSGRRSTEALDKALKLGYCNSKNYLGSWEEWSSKKR